jgi:hypothetical protein
MSKFQRLREATAEFGEEAVIWGRRDERAVSDIETALKTKLPDSVCDFVWEFGNVNLSPFAVVIAGNEADNFSCVTETRALRKRHPSIPDDYVQIMRYAGVVYCMDAGNAKTSRVIAWDEHYPPIEGSIVREFESFHDFVDWLVIEARDIALDTRFEW